MMAFLGLYVSVCFIIYLIVSNLRSEDDFDKVTAIVVIGIILGVILFVIGAVNAPVGRYREISGYDIMVFMGIALFCGSFGAMGASIVYEYGKQKKWDSSKTAALAFLATLGGILFGLLALAMGSASLSKVDENIRKKSGYRY